MSRREIVERLTLALSQASLSAMMVCLFRDVWERL